MNLLLHQSDEQESDVHAFIEEIRKYAAIKELDEVVLNRLIKKIMIGEVQKVDGQKIQKVKIIYNFVGEISAQSKIENSHDIALIIVTLLVFLTGRVFSFANSSLDFTAGN